MCLNSGATRWMAPITASPSATASAPPGQKSFCTSMTMRTSCASIRIGSPLPITQPAHSFSQIRIRVDEETALVLCEKHVNAIGAEQVYILRSEFLVGDDDIGGA